MAEHIIDADRLKNTLVIMANKCGGKLDILDISDAIEISQTIDRPHGEWKLDCEWGCFFHCVCSKCNADVMKYISGSENWWLNSLPNFCPNCGSDNRKEPAP